MDQKQRSIYGRGTVDPKKTKQAGAIIVAAVALIKVVLPILTRTVRRGLGAMPSLFTVWIIVLAVIGVAGLIAGLAAGKIKKKHAPWSFGKDSDDEMMHTDHYRRTERKRSRYSADPCAYSERHSWRKSQTYDDPWDF